MSKDKISDYSATANSNTDIGGINIDEGCAPSGINDAIRTLMKQLKDFQQGTQSDVFKGPLQVGAASSIEVTDNTNAALRITQLGTGNALLVEDSSNPDASPFVIDASGNVGIGTSSPSTKLDIAGTGSIASQITGTTSSIYRAVASTTGISYFACGDTDDVYVGGLAYNHTDDSLDISANNAVRATINSSGTFSLASTSGLSIGRTAVTSPASTDGNVFSGTYTPSLTNTTNIAASTPYQFQYTRIGNVVTVSGRVNIDPTTSAAASELGISLPITSAFPASATGVSNLAGVGSIQTTTTEVSTGGILADTTNDRAQFRFVAGGTAARDYAISFTYLVV